MWGLRGKLLLGFGGLLFILLGVSLLGNTVLNSYSDATQRMLREDLDGIEASQHISLAVESIDEGLRVIAGGGGSPSGAAESAAESGALGLRLGPGAQPGAATAAGDLVVTADARRQTLLGEIRRQADLLDQSLRLQVAGQTLPHERDVTARLGKDFAHFLRRDFFRLRQGLIGRRHDHVLKQLRIGRIDRRAGAGGRRGRCTLDLLVGIRAGGAQAGGSTPRDGAGDHR